MKKRIAMLLAAALLLSCPLPALAAATEYVYDYNGTLSNAELDQLNALAAETYSRYGFDILIDMDDSVTESASTYAVRRYGELGGAANGVLLAVTESSGSVHLAGDAQAVFTAAHVDQLWDAYNREHTYFEGVAAYLAAADEMLRLHYGEGTAPAAPGIPATRQKPRLVDEAGLLTTAEREALLARLDEISERQACDVAIVTVYSLEGKASDAYADDYYDYNGYGMGDGDDGILLLISMEERDWAISTYGFAIPAFTVAGQAYIVNKFKSDLSAGNYAAAFGTFAGLCDDFLQEAKTGTPYGKGHLPDTIAFWPYLLSRFRFFLPIGFLLSLLITSIMKRKLITVEAQRAAGSYLRQGGASITAQSDRFLYRNLSKVSREAADSGGSNTRTSSSGRKHGGSKGKF